MKRYPFIGDPGVIVAPVETMNAVAGIVFDLETEGQPVNVADGMIVQNTGSTGTLPGRVAVIFKNTDALGDLVVTPVVRAVMSEVCGKEIAAISEEITIAPGEVGIIGPLTRALEDATGKVTFTFTGVEGRCYAVNTR